MLQHPQRIKKINDLTLNQITGNIFPKVNAQKKVCFRLSGFSICFLTLPCKFLLKTKKVKIRKI